MNSFFYSGGAKRYNIYLKGTILKKENLYSTKNQKMGLPCQRKRNSLGKQPQERNACYLNVHTPAFPS